MEGVRWKKEDGRRKKEEGRGKKEDIVLIDVICYAKALVDWEESVTFANCMETEIEIKSFAQRVKKLLESQPIISSGMEYEGKYEFNNNYVVGLKMGEEDYTVKLAIGVKNGYTYYDHALTPIEKKKLLRSIDEIKRPFASKEVSNDREQVSDVLSECKDKRLISIFQIL